jgi:protein SCO1/2/putative membrane protein
MDYRDLPALNATLNATATVLLVWGYRLIRAGRREAHRQAMLAAFAMSVLFLISYLIYHAQVGSVPFQKQGLIRNVYFFILITHVVLAALVPFLAGVTLWRAWKGQFERHRKVARWTFPIWLYVSVTGVVVYLMLYQL